MGKYKKLTSRIRDLITEFEKDIYSQRISIPLFGGGIRWEYPDSLSEKISAWLIKVENVIVLTFKKKSLQHERFISTRTNDKNSAAIKLDQIKGILVGSLDDLENGFMEGQEFIIANEVFDSVLEEAKFFLGQKNKDISAILLRIVLEDSLRRISAKEGLSTLDMNGKHKKASLLNDELKGIDFYNQTVWRQIQVWLDIGNDAAHGDFEKYDINQVSSFYEGLVIFITNYFKG